MTKEEEKSEDERLRKKCRTDKSKRSPEGRTRFFRKRPEEVRTTGLYAYILARGQEKMFSVLRLCAFLPVSETGYYKWKRSRCKPEAWRKLLTEIHKILG